MNERKQAVYLFKKITLKYLNFHCYHYLDISEYVNVYFFLLHC